MKPTTDLPDDAALPGIVAMRALGVTRTLGLARALLAWGLDDAPVSMHLVGYSPGERATLEVRVAQHRLAVKAYAEDPTPEVILYQALSTRLATPEELDQIRRLLNDADDGGS